jgi:ADP-ribosylarginine hydrolase
MGFYKKIEASLVFLSFCDTLGYHNGHWEFNFGINVNSIEVAQKVNTIISNQIYGWGGISKINLRRFKSSDDTLLTLATVEGLINGKKNTKNTIQEIKKSYIKIYDTLKNQERGTGISTLTNLKKLIDGKKIPYSDKLGGNGATVRAAPIGLVFYDDIDALIHVSVQSAILTHNYIIGYMGAVIVALFTSFALKNVPPWKWIEKLLEILMSGKMETYFKQNGGIEEYESGIDFIINTFSDFQEKRVDKFLNQSDMYIHQMNRWKFLSDYSPQIFAKPVKDYSQLGSNGIDVILVALDSLISCLLSDKDKPDPNKFNDFDFSWESLVYFSTLHFGDNDSTGALAGFWYGCLFEYKDVFGRFDTLEFYNDIIEKSKELVSINETN